MAVTRKTTAGPIDLDPSIVSPTLETATRRAAATETAEMPRASEDSFRLLFTSHPEPMWVYDLQTLAFLEVNDAAVDQYGYTRDEFLRLRITEIRPEEDEARVRDDVRRPRPALQHSGAWRHRRKDGQLIDVEITSHTITFAGRTAALVSARDITARRRAEQHTREALEALLSMARVLVQDPVEAAPEATTEAMMRRLAEMACRVLACQRVRLVLLERGTDALRPVAVAGASPAQEERFRGALQGVLLHQRFSPDRVALLRSGESVVLGEDSTVFGALHVVIVPIQVDARLVGFLDVDYGVETLAGRPGEHDLAGTVAGLVALVLERERLRHEREEARTTARALREANRRIEEFLSIAGHELRTPLTSVLGNMQLAAQWVDELRREQEEEARATPSGWQAAGLPVRLMQVSTLLQRMERQGRLLNRLVSDLLDTSRIQAGRLALRPEPADLANLVREIVREYRQQLPLRTVNLAVPPAVAPVSVDAERIGQVLSNYLANAFKFSASDQPVTVGLWVEGPMARVWVRDTGPGLPAAEHERVWERFYRASSSTHQTGSSVGLGLGLHISRSIVERHGGRVGVHSALGTGATFWFTVPLAPRDARMVEERPQMGGDQLVSDKEIGM